MEREQTTNAKILQDLVSNIKARDDRMEKRMQEEQKEKRKRSEITQEQMKRRNDLMEEQMYFQVFTMKVPDDPDAQEYFQMMKKKKLLEMRTTIKKLEETYDPASGNESDVYSGNESDAY